MGEVKEKGKSDGPHYPIFRAHLRAAPRALGTPPIWQDQQEPMSRFRTGVSIRMLMTLL